MSYSIFRVQKVTGKNGNNTNSKSLQIHNQREKKEEQKYENKDIDPSRTHLNYDLINQEKIDYNQRIEERIAEGYNGKRKVRTDAIKHVQGLVTSDEEFFDKLSPEKQKEYFKDTLEFIKDEYGEENIIYATVHLDEKTPHMHFGFVPLTEDGRLSAKEMLGNKKSLSLLQDRFNNFVNEKGYNLERGEKRTERKHLEMQEYKAKTLEEKISGLESELIEKQEIKEQTSKSIERIQDELIELNNASAHSKEIEKIQFKEKKGLKKEKIILDRPDFDRLLSDAKTSESRRIENDKLTIRNLQLEKLNYNFETKSMELTTENKNLKQENENLKQENKSLKKQVTFLQRTIEKMKSHFKDHVQEMGMKVGYIKAELLRKMNMDMLKSHFSDKEEISGAQVFIQKNRPQKEQEKEGEMEL